MATKICFQCRSDVDSLAKICPQCRTKLGDSGANGIAKKPMRPLAIGCMGCGGLVLLFIFIGVISSGKNTPPIPSSTVDQRSTHPPPVAQAKDNFTAEVLKAYNSKSNGTGSGKVDFDKIKDNDISITITYDQILPLSSVARDTKMMVLAVLAKLLVDGHKPAKESYTIFVYGQTRVQGVTGTPKVLLYGAANYDYINDTVEFSPRSKW